MDAGPQTARHQADSSTADQFTGRVGLTIVCDIIHTTRSRERTLVIVFVTSEVKCRSEGLRAEAYLFGRSNDRQTPKGEPSGVCELLANRKRAADTGLEDRSAVANRRRRRSADDFASRIHVAIIDAIGKP